MLRRSGYKKYKNITSIILLGYLVFGTAQNSWADERWKRGHDDRDYAYNEPECRDVIKKVKVGKRWYTEHGTACWNDFGHWEMVTPTRFPVGKMYFIDHGVMVFIGDYRSNNDEFDAPYFDNYGHGRPYDWNDYHGHGPKCHPRHR